MKKKVKKQKKLGKKGTSIYFNNGKKMDFKVFVRIPLTSYCVCSASFSIVHLASLLFKYLKGGGLKKWPLGVCSSHFCPVWNSGFTQRSCHYCRGQKLQLQSSISKNINGCMLYELLTLAALLRKVAHAAHRPKLV